MDLVHEHDGPCSQRRHPVSLLHDILDVLDPARDRAERDELRVGAGSDYLGKSSLAHAGRPPEDHRGYTVPLYHCSEDFALSDKMLLPDVFIEISRAHPGRQRLTAVILCFKQAYLTHNYLILSVRRYDFCSSVILRLSIAFCMALLCVHFASLCSSSTASAGSGCFASAVAKYQAIIMFI